MKEEKLLRAIGGIDDDLIDSAMETQKKKHPTWVRWAAVAACLCLLVASPVGAYMGEALETFIRDGRIEHTNTDRLRLEDLSPEALADFPDNAGEARYITMDAKEDAEAYLGFDLPDNPVLEASVADQLHLLNEYAEELHSHCIIRLSTGKELEPICVDAEFAYRMGGVPINVMYRYATEKNEYDTAAAVGVEVGSFDASEYTDGDGRVWSLYLKEGEDGKVGAMALSKVNGTLTWIDIMVSNLSRESMNDLMIEIMEAYE